MFPNVNFHARFCIRATGSTWFGVGVLWLLVQLPYPVFVFSWYPYRNAGSSILKRRESIARKISNSVSQICHREERDKLVDENFRSLGMGLLETGMAWFWPDRRVRKWFDVEGLDNLKRAQMQNRGVMVVGVHFMSLELGGRVMGLCQPMMATYRPHNNKLMEWIQNRGRMRSNKAMIGRNNLRRYCRRPGKGEAVWFAPIRTMVVKGSSFALLRSQRRGDHQRYLRAVTIIGRSNADQTMVRKADNTGYRLFITQKWKVTQRQMKAGCGVYEQNYRKEIMRAPEQYLWIHRRFKTRPMVKLRCISKKKGRKAFLFYG